ncbi:hypothetical protein H2200_008706 [Cladophialophora chaetospira]|uniref:Uncharacterized protein n=1 Tax=Cladophialophora chaetospira TaxID=386627 RepID=A0AA39CFK3_9EURO|nr:hypothetical protein H2200_008706 [Cladophialophora chaetospira]
MGYCKHDGCLAEVDRDGAQERHDEVFEKNCSGHGCYTGSQRSHVLAYEHTVCGFGDCKGYKIKFESDTAFRRHWNNMHRDGDEEIFEDIYGDNLDDGYHSDSAA